MKKNNIHILIALICCPFLNAQNREIPRTDGSTKIQHLSLQQQEETLFLTFDAVVSGQAMNFRQSWSIIPELNFENTELLQNLPIAKTSIIRHTDTTLTYMSEIPYEGWMDNATLSINQLLTSPREKKQLFVIKAINRAEQRVPDPVAPPVRPHFIEPQMQPKERNIEATAYLDFPVGSTTIQPGYRNNPAELAPIEHNLRSVTGNKDMQIRTVSLHGYASPEGSESLNSRLAAERAAALREYIIRTYTIPLAYIHTSSTAEDWKGLETLIDETDLRQREEPAADHSQRCHTGG